MARGSLAALLFLFVACSDDGPMTETCIPGASVACTCPDGTMGAQVCTAEGTFNPCSCSPGADAGAVDAGDDGPDAGGADGGAPDDGGAESDGAVAGCYDEGAALVAPGDSVAVEQEHCTEQDVADVFACVFDGDDSPECADDFGLTSPFDPDAPKSACADCLLGLGGASGPAPVALTGAEVTFLNAWACQAAALGQPDCGIELSQRVFCQQTACEGCGGDELGACLSEAAEGICSELALRSVCEPLLEEELASECTGADFEASFLAIGTYFCGGAPVRGG